MKIIDILTNCPDPDTADRIGRAIVEARLAACFNRYAEIESGYHWKGDIETARETPLWLKTRADLWDAVCEKVRELHPYETPSILCIDIARANQDYIDWIHAETS